MIKIIPAKRETITCRKDTLIKSCFQVLNTTSLEVPVAPKSSQIQKKETRIFTKNKSIRMSLLNQQKGKKKNDKKKNQNAAGPGSKFIQKPQTNTFVSKQANTGSQRGS
jgi:hypothetical protein